MNIEHISVSRSKTYSQCPQCYKYQYHDKIPSPEVEPFYFVYGKIIHKIAETYVEEKGNRTLGEVTTDVLRGKIEIEPDKKAPSLPQEYKNRMPGHLRSIQNLTDKIGSDGIVEHKFHYDLDPPNQKYVTGFIDRLIIKNDQAFILDYKTTKKGPYRVNRDTVLFDPQLRCYSRVVQKEFGIEPKNIKAALYYLEGGDLIAASYTAESLLNIEKELLEIYNKIKDHEPDRVWGKTGPHCTRCVYKSICPFVRNSRSIESWDGDMSQL